ncbi:SAM-dependent methyltransferase [Catenuloplanes sp. NPDC051500]|uniref:SAM-dependent methyltransferase n=1 Tax=Catenuloplanes sp. NPDC051500 TaxID=3363959 RepID=UPI00378EC74E
MPPLELNTTVAHSARIYDYLLGGKDNFEADRKAAEAIMQSSPSLPISMRANRDYMVRAARHLTRDHGIRQFLDIGTGLPTSPNLHEVVQQVAPESRVVYVDNDPLVLAHARALLSSHADGITAYLDADLRDVPAILGAKQLLETLDLSKPVAISLIAVLQFVTEEAEAHAIIDELLSAVPAGSALAISTVTANSAQAVGAAAGYKARGIPAKPRTDDEVRGLFRTLELEEPGVVMVHRWRPEPGTDPAEQDPHVQMSGGVAIKR